MKLRNKKTGKIINAVMTGENEIEFQERGSLDRYTYSSLAELNEEWEDYEEPEGWWYIGRCNEPHATNSTLRDMMTDQEIGNYFLSKEEAEKAIEKLKAWKRLRDNGFRFTGWNGGERNIYFHAISIEDGGVPKIMWDDLDLLFGGEE